jgi:enoyl-CoA hydratase
MEYKQITLEKSNGIGKLTLNRPEKLNAVTMVMMQEFSDAINNVENDPEIKVLIIKGAGRSFCAGHDLNEMDPVETKPYAITTPIFKERRETFKSTKDVLFRLWELPQPIIAQVHGFALVWGYKIAMNCDLVYAAENATFGYRPLGGAARLDGLWPWLIGMRKSKELLFTGEYISGRQAADMGLINDAVPLEKLESTVEEMAQKIARLPLEILALNKTAVNRCFEMMGLREGVSYSLELHTMAHDLPAQHELEQTLREKGVKQGVAQRDAQFEKK